MTLEELIDDVEDGVKRELEALLDNTDYWNQLKQIAEGWVPQKDSVLAECLVSDNSLADVDDEGGLPENPTIWQTLALAIGERLFQAAYKCFDSEKKDYEDFVDSMKDEEYEVVLSLEDKLYYIHKHEIAAPAHPEGFKSPYKAWKWLEGQDVL